MAAIRFGTTPPKPLPLVFSIENPPRNRVIWIRRSPDFSVFQLSPPIGDCSQHYTVKAASIQAISHRTASEKPIVGVWQKGERFYRSIAGSFLSV